MTGPATMTPRWHEEVGFFEIWFVVAFDRRAPRAWWIRYTTFAPRTGAARGTIWAAAFTAERPAQWGKQIVPTSEVHARVADLAGGRCGGAIEVDGRRLAWDLTLDGGEGVVRGPTWLDRAPTPTRVAHVRSEAAIAGTVHVDGEPHAVEATGAVKHIWGTRRVEELFWVYCPSLDADGAFEATGVRVRRGKGPAVTPVWLRAGGCDWRWWGLPGIFRNRVVPDGAGRLRVQAVSATQALEAVAVCDPRTLAGYVYRDPAGWDVHVAQSDVATCEVTLRTRPHQLAAWGAVHRLVGARAAVEFHHPEPLPGVRYVAWDAPAASRGRR